MTRTKANNWTIHANVQCGTTFVQMQNKKVYAFSRHTIAKLDVSHSLMPMAQLSWRNNQLNCTHNRKFNVITLIIIMKFDLKIILSSKTVWQPRQNQIVLHIKIPLNFKWCITVRFHEKIWVVHMIIIIVGEVPCHSIMITTYLNH